MGAFRDKVTSMVENVDPDGDSSYSFLIAITEADRAEAKATAPKVKAETWLIKEATFACVGHGHPHCVLKSEDELWVRESSPTELR
ncbi:MAG TPA: hypothetical protein VLT33_38790 [Labilithrix sp.]|nr:hypothetical protein [Labilithrix sp.]